MIKCGYCEKRIYPDEDGMARHKCKKHLPCGNCGTPLDIEERKSMHEFDGKMFSEELTENIRIIRRETMVEMMDHFFVPFSTPPTKEEFAAYIEENDVTRGSKK